MVIFPIIVAFLAASATSQVVSLERPQRSETELVRKCFGSYRHAILNQKGSDALRLVSRATIDYYSKLQQLALRGKREEIHRLSTMDKLGVLVLRHRVSVNAINAMMPQEVFVYAVDHGWIGKNSVLETSVGKVRLRGNHATAEQVLKEKPTGFQFHFDKEDGAWKFDLTSLMPLANMAMKLLIKQQNREEDQFLLELLESVSGARPSSSIWDPLEP